MPSPAEIPQRDEALKSLVEKFEAAPGSRAFVELAAALLARGHASESLRVVEHGLQIVPNDVDGRVERAAALLALGRPRVAYVELLRALAIHPDHKRGMRLLGKTFRDAGAPHRAAALLAKRSKRPASEVSSTVQAPPPEPETLKSRPSIDTPPERRPTGDAMPALFSALTKDLGLGLGSAVPNRKAAPRVEVTQIMRRKRAPRPPRSDSELAEIDGPIVDTTQPGKIESMGLDDEPAGVTAREPAPLWNDKTPGLTDFSDDEPLFQEHMPFAVRPVAGAVPTPAAGLDPVGVASLEDEPGDTVVDEIEDSGQPLDALGAPDEPAPMNLLDLPGPPDLSRPSTSDLELPPTLPPTKGAPANPAPPPNAAPPPLSPQRSPAPYSAEPKRSPAPATVDQGVRGPEGTPAPPPMPERAAPTVPMARRPDPRAPTNLIPPADTAPLTAETKDDRPFEAAGALVEKAARKDQGLVVESPPMPRGRLVLALVAAVLMSVYVGGLVWVSADTLSVWWSDAPKGSAPTESAVDTPEARAQRP